MSYNETFDINIALRAFLILELPNLNIIFILGQMIIWKGGKTAKYMWGVFPRFHY